MPNTIQSDGTLWAYEYNNRRLPTAETMNYGGVNYRIGRGYDANGSLSQLTYPDNFSMTYNPNALGQARQAGGYAGGVSYYPNGALKQFSYGNGIVHTLDQNVRGLPAVSRDGNWLHDSYTYDNNGNVNSITDQAEGVTTRVMEYDGLDRLKRVNAPALWGDAWYNYDALDNLTYSHITGGAKARQLSHNFDAGTNRLDSITGTYNIGYQYDSQGNIIQRGGQGYSFDIGNRMRGAPGVTTHTYDGHGRRVSVVGTDGVNHVYIYGLEGKLLYSHATGQPLALGTKYIYLNRHVIAESSTIVVLVHTDGLGSPVAKTDAGGGLISRTRYEAYGATAAGTEPTIGFTGHLNAANLGLVDMQQRFYDPVAGRFLSIDPVVTNSHNGSRFSRYTYAENNPYFYVDPDGRTSQILESPPIVLPGPLPIIVQRVEIIKPRPRFDQEPDPFASPVPNSRPASEDIKSAAIVVIQTGCRIAPMLCGQPLWNSGEEQSDENDLVKIPEKKGNKAAQDAGYIDAHDAKSGRGDSKVNIYNDKTTGKKWLWDGKKGSGKEVL